MPISQIGPEQVGETVYLAGKISETNHETREVTISDGTGVAKVTAARNGPGDYLLEIPSGECIEFDGVVERIPETADSDVIMSHGEDEPKE